LFGRPRIVDVVLSLALLAALVLFVGVTNYHYPVQTWLAWHYLSVGILAVAWALACLSCGHFLLERLRINPANAALERVLAFPLGVFAFQIAIFVLGLAGLLGVGTFFLLPAVFAIAGARGLVRDGRDLRNHTLPRSLPQLAVLLFGVAGVGLIYFPLLSPETFSWDAQWYHLPIAQQYALQGAIRPFPEGWWMDGAPHAASLVYTWAFLLPGSILFDRLELCGHLEFVIFLATIASIPTLVRQLVPRIEAGGSWAAIFLFPGILLYDSNLAGGADHVAALLCVPLALTLIRLWHTWRVREATLFGIFMGAGVAAKFSVWSMLLFPGLAFVVRAIWLTVSRVVRRDRAGVAVLPAFLAGGAAILLSSAHHWLKNWLWYGDPIYPVLQDYLHVRPWSSEAPASYRLFKSFTFGPPPGMAGVWEALKATLTFSLKPNDWPVFHRDVPVFGSLFTLSMFCLPFIRAGIRLWLAYLGVMLAIVAWYLTSHQDRYIQAWLPVMVACTVATLALVWNRRSLLVRALVVALVAVQIVWGADVPFFPTHNMINNDSPIRFVSNFLASGFLKTPNRLRLFGEAGLVGERLPRNANLLIHEFNPQIGFGAHTVNDQWQGRLSYAALASPAAIYRELADMKVTHLVWYERTSGWNSVGSDLAFLGFALNHCSAHELIGHLTLARLPETPPSPSAFNDRVAVLACNNPYPNGFYTIESLVIPEPQQPWASPQSTWSDAAAAVRDASFLVVDPRCTPNLPPEVPTWFHPPILRSGGELRLYIRRR
jgi:hypothetical protein